MKCFFSITSKKGILVPCGKCGACISNRVNDWKFRLRVQQEVSPSFFVTLTYNDDNLPPYGVDKDEIQRFFKRLRHVLPPFKYYCISEYGPHTFRPHYHFIIYVDSDWDKVYDSICSTWINGNIKVAELNDERITYVSNYHVTKGFNPADKNDNFVLQSKGLGANYLKSHRVKHFLENNINTTTYLGYRVSLPRYYKERLCFTQPQKQKFRDYAEQFKDSERSYDEVRRLKYWTDKVYKKTVKKKNHI